MSAAPGFGAAQQVAMVGFGESLGGVWMHGLSSRDIVPELALVGKSQFLGIGSENGPLEKVLGVAQQGMRIAAGSLAHQSADDRMVPAGVLAPEVTCQPR
jgi:hypothetical protein